MDTPITRAEHEEFVRRIEDEEHRQNRRLEVIEGNIAELMKLTASIERLATNMENMLKEQEKQGDRLESLEAQDGKKWRQISGYVVTTVVGIVIGYIFFTDWNVGGNFYEDRSRNNCKDNLSCGCTYQPGACNVWTQRSADRGRCCGGYRDECIYHHYSSSGLVEK